MRDLVEIFPVERRRALTGQLLWFLAWVAITGVAVWLNPSKEGHGTHTQLGLPACPSVAVLDRPCPGCGLTTSFTSVVHGQLKGAFLANWFGPIFYLLFTATAMANIWGWATKRRIDFSTPKFNRWLGALAIVFVVYGFGRLALVKYESPHYMGQVLDAVRKDKAGGDD